MLYADSDGGEPDLWGPAVLYYCDGNRMGMELYSVCRLWGACGVSFLADPADCKRQGDWMAVLPGKGRIRSGDSYSASSSHDFVIQLSAGWGL